jgi:hypothetical protein
MPSPFVVVARSVSLKQLFGVIVANASGRPAPHSESDLRGTEKQLKRHPDSPQSACRPARAINCRPISSSCRPHHARQVDPTQLHS